MTVIKIIAHVVPWTTYPTSPWGPHWVAQTTLLVCAATPMRPSNHWSSSSVCDSNCPRPTYPTSLQHIYPRGTSHVCPPGPLIPQPTHSIMTNITLFFRYSFSVRNLFRWFLTSCSNCKMSCLALWFSFSERSRSTYRPVHYALNSSTY